MAERRRRRGWGIFAAGTSFSLVFAWPLLGALESFGWQRVFHAASPGEIIASRLIDLVPDRSGEVGIHYIGKRYSGYGFTTAVPDYNGRDCYQSLIQRSIGDLEGSPRAALSAIVRVRHARDGEEVRRHKIAALTAMPGPLLGALGGCVDASLASKFCLNYIDRKLRRVLTEAAPDIHVQFAKNALNLQKMACVVLDGVSAAPRTRSSPRT